jgi:hypothetical protein
MTKQLKSVTWRALPAPASNAARGQELEVIDRRVEALGPMRRVALRGGEGGRHATPGIFDRLVDRLAHASLIGRRLEPILHVPDLLRDRGDVDHLERFLS